MKKDWVARELTIEVLVGAFLVMILLGLGYFTIILSRDALIGKKIVKEICFKNVMGLGKGDSVVSRGMTVGTVKDMMLQEGTGRVRVIINIDQPIDIRLGYEISIVSASLLGGRYLEIQEGVGGPLPEGHVLMGVEPLDLVSDAAEVINAAKRGVTEGKMIDNFVEASRQLKEISTRLNAGEGVIGSLLTGDSQLYRDVTGVTSSLKNITQRLEKGQGVVGKLLAEEDFLYDDLASTVASLKVMSKRLEEGKGSLGALLSEDDQVYRDLAAAATSLKNTAEKIEKGEGTIGKFVSDEALYDEVKGVVGEARAAIDDFRETTPIVTFTSIFFGAF